MAIRIVVTGGTFDKEYDEIRGRLYFRKTHVLEMLERARSRLPVRLSALMLKDSLELSPSDRAKIARACAQAREKRVIVTHGTDTMVETARVIAASKLEKTIVLTGAMIPYKFGGSSDGLFNLGSALSFAQVLPPGVWIAMNGEIFEWNNVRKNRQKGRFERLSALLSSLQ